MLGVLGVDDAALLELQPEVVALARAFADAAEHRHTAVLHRDVVDELHDDDGLAHAGPAEQANLAALEVGLEQVDDLDARLEHLELGGLVLQRRRRPMDRPVFLGVDRTAGVVDRLAEHVQDPAERLRTDRDGDRGAEILGDHAALHAIGRLHRDGADAVLAQVLLDLGDDVDLPRLLGVCLDAQGVVNLRKAARLELDVDDGTNDLDDASDSFFSHEFSHQSACAPETTSMISRVIAAWRTLFM